MSTERVTTHYPDPKDFEQILESAEAADPRGEAADFVASLREKFDEYGSGMFLSAKQNRWLRKLAGERDG